MNRIYWSHMPVFYYNAKRRCLLNGGHDGHSKESKNTSKADSDFGEFLQGLGLIGDGDGKSSKNSCSEDGGGVTRNFNHIYFNCSVDAGTVQELINELNDANAEIADIVSSYSVNSTAFRIYLHITSTGGNIMAAFRAIDAILSSKVPIISVVEGYAASAGSLMSCVATERWITKNSYILIHQLQSGFGGCLREIRDDMENLEELHERIRKILLEHSKLTTEIDTSRKRKRAHLKGNSLVVRPISNVDDAMGHDIYWNAEESLRIGLVDKII